MAWRCRFLAARRSQHGRVIVHPTHCLICAQVTLTIGGLWVEVHMNYIYGHIAAWAPLENNQAPDKLGLLRAQQMFFVTAPLHTLAIFQGVALCGKQPVRRMHDNSSPSHFSAMTRPCWLRRAARSRHRHAIELAADSMAWRSTR